MDINIYSINRIMEYFHIANKRIILVHGSSIIDILFCKLIGVIEKKITILSAKKIKKNQVDISNCIIFVCSIFDIDKVCRELRNRVEEGKDFFCLRPISYNFFSWQKEWKNIEFFTDVWENRIKKMTSMISPEIVNVIDLGCGEGKLKNILPTKINYYGVDYKRRNDGTIVCDFNHHEFPELLSINKLDASKTAFFCSGCFEYIDDPKWFVRKLRYAQEVIISYTVFEHKKQKRNQLGFKNHFTSFELNTLITKHGFKCEKASYFGGQILFKFVKEQNGVFI